MPQWQQRGGVGELPGAPEASYPLKQNFIPVQDRQDVGADSSVPYW